MVGSVLSYYSLLQYLFDLKATQMNMQHSRIQELVCYEFKLSHNVLEATKTISCVKQESTIDHSTVTGWVKKMGFKNLVD